MITKDPLTLLRDALTEARDALVDATISTCNDYDAHVGRINTALAMTADASDPAPTLDPVVEANRALLHQRSQVGLKKYGVPLAGTSLTECELMTHALEEALDFANYLQAILQRRATRPAPVVATVAVDERDTDDAEADHDTILALGRLLADIAITMKGEEAPRQRHGYHDLPEMVRVMAIELDIYRTVYGRKFPEGWGDAAAPAAPTTRKFSMTPALRKAVIEWGCATNGCEDADVHLLEVLNAMATAAPDDTILKLSIDALTKHFNALVGACMDAAGNPVAPPRKALMQARACLPTSASNSFNPAPAAPIEKGRASKGMLGFVDSVIEVAFEGGNLDGGEIQDMAVHHGLLKEQTMREPCAEGDQCRCAGNDAFPLTCYRKAYNLAAEQAKPEPVERTTVLHGVDLAVIARSYDWTIDQHGELLGVTSGDMGYEATGIKLSGDTLDIWNDGVSKIVRGQQSGAVDAVLRCDFIKKIDDFGNTTIKLPISDAVDADKGGE